ncbi:MAG: sulfatase-like hydrolase/transferase [Chloroflexi bacterium]|nr:sulfatase-like hydrolase/transferase [Chloroflexota bacterium]
MSESPIPPQIRSSTFRVHSLPKPQGDGRPNILLLMTDQQRFDTLNAGGYKFMRTPNLDRLVHDGRLYRNAYSPNPICLAARHNMLTGLPARFHGFPDNMQGVNTRADLPMLPRILSDNGYETHAIGKMHFVPPRRHNGLERLQLMEELPWYREDDDYALYLKSVGLGHIQHIHGVRHLLYMLPQRSLIPEDHHGSKWVADRGIEYLSANQGRKPFFLWLSWIAPHPPFDVPDRFAELYQGADLPQPHRSETPTSLLAVESELLGDLPNEQYVQRMREVYYGAVSHVDEQVGRVLDTLDELGLAGNTLVIFLSDHGELLGDYDLYQKWLPYDSCSRIPMILRYPDHIEPGSRCDDFVDLNDVLPTVLDVAGIDYPGNETLAGESLLAESGVKERGWQYMEYSFDNRRWISIRNRRFKYNYYYGGGIEELFDLIADPYETKNLLWGDVPSELESIRTELRAKLAEYETKWGLAGYVSDKGELLAGPPYEPHPQRNEAFPRFPSQIMNQTEKAQMNDLFDEVRAAIAREPVVQLHQLDIAAWQAKGGFSDEAIIKLIHSDRK